MNISDFMQATILNLYHSCVMGVRKSDDVKTFDLDLIWSFCSLRSPLSYCCLVIFSNSSRDSASTNDYQMVENMPFHSPSHHLYLGLLHFSYCSSYSMLPCFKYFPCHAVLVSHQTTCSHVHVHWTWKRTQSQTICSLSLQLKSIRGQLTLSTRPD